MSSGTNAERIIQNNEALVNIENRLLDVITAIDNLPTRDNPDFSDTTAIEEEIFVGKTAYINGKKVIGTLSQFPSGNFDDKNAEILLSLLKAYDGVDVKTLVDNENYTMLEMKIIPTKLNGNPLVDFSELSTCKFLFLNNPNIEYVDTANMTKAIYAESMFEGCINLVGIKRIEAYLCKSTKAMFKGCSQLLNVPNFITTRWREASEMFMGASSITTIETELDTSLVEDMTYMFSGCTSLKNIDQLETSHCLDMTGIFTDCESLNKRSLINILEMCIAVSEEYKGDKTLTAIGLSEAQKVQCEELSNYSAFLEAGWNL